MLAEKDGPDRDIELFIDAYCQANTDAGPRALCCEQVTLKASGRYVQELPSATTPLLVPDLPVFLWWRDSFGSEGAVFKNLGRAADRLVLDSTLFRAPQEELLALVQFLQSKRAAGLAVSDFNWSRLTSWRTLLAGFYDVTDYLAPLSRLARVRIEYVAASADESAVAPQALMMAGWLASRLGWKDAAATGDGARSLTVQGGQGRLTLEFERVTRPEMKPGRLASVGLHTEGDAPASFVVRRSPDGLYLETQAHCASEVSSSRVLPVRNRSEAVLLGRELEIIGRDSIYEEAVGAAAPMIELLGGSPG
jgi:glucose-6-phosphate dehydrogenase assembly protein OpcA